MKNTTRIGIVLVITLAFFSVEIIVGFKTKSLALIADAFHYLNDVVAYAIAFIATYLHNKGGQTFRYTFAFYRAELVGAFFNGVFLLALALSIFLQSLERFVHIEAVEQPFLVLIVGCLGLALNVISAAVIHDHHGHGSHEHQQSSPMDVFELSQTGDSLLDQIHAAHNHTTDPPVATRQHNLGLLGVLIHVLGDAVNNVGVIIAAVIMWKTQSSSRFYADPAISLMISFMIFGSAIPLTLRSARILLEATPLYLGLSKVKEDLLATPNVLSVHDLHAWHLSQSVILASLHVSVPTGTTMEQWERTEQTLQHCLQAYGISHATISPELERSQVQFSDEGLMLSGECKRISSQDDFGCAISGLVKR